MAVSENYKRFVNAMRARNGQAPLVTDAEIETYTPPRHSEAIDRLRRLRRGASVSDDDPDEPLDASDPDVKYFQSTEEAVEFIKESARRARNEPDPTPVTNDAKAVTPAMRTMLARSARLSGRAR